MHRQLRLVSSLLILCSASLWGAAPPDIEQWVARTMKTFDVPGIAVGIVKDGKIELSRGFGVRNLGSTDPVDAHTVFGIASNSKAFTTAALAILVDDGKLSWDDPVQKYLPSFQVYDPYVSRELTVRDLVSHRTGLGLGAGDLLFWPDTDVSREQVVAAARHIRPKTSLRSKYAYNNLMFVVAGQAVAAASGKPWEEFVRERIFGALGMTESSVASEPSHTGANVAEPHSRGWRLEGSLTPIQPTRDDTWAAAAGVRSNITDLARWVTAQLARGKVDGGRRLFSEAQSKEMWSPQTILPISQPSVPALETTRPNFAAYGLGWTLRDYQGRKLVAHGGALTGMVTSVLLVPEEQLGIVVLTNQEESGAMSSITYHVLDHYFGLVPTDWIKAFSAARKEELAKAAAAERKLDAERAALSKPSLELPKYAGEYVDDWYGKASISNESGKLVLRMLHSPAMTGDLLHWQYDTFKVVWRDKTIPEAFVTFDLDYRGRIEFVKLAATSPLADFSFDYHDLLFRPAAVADRASPPAN